ncbi:MAG: TatD family hydrolase [Coriobacteriia bacterium]|nr:TatD family hydrolase [Coriobacteriia bacterium]
MSRDDRSTEPAARAATPPVDLPELGTAVADTHAHLDMLDDPAGALERAGAAGVAFIATVADVTEEPLGTFDGLAAWEREARERLREWGNEHLSIPETRIIVGVHPHNAKHHDAIVEAELRSLALDPRVCAIGEVGLDFHYDHSPREDQRAMFRAHLAIAHELGLPVCVHLREAHEEGLRVLAELGVPEAGCIIHCFTEGPKTAELFLELGCHIAFGGVVSFPKADVVREAVAVVPLDRMLLETDCPFLAPAPYRGRTNEPAFVTLTAAAVAAIRGVNPVEIASRTYENARALLARGGAA